MKKIILLVLSAVLLSCAGPTDPIIKTVTETIYQDVIVEVPAEIPPEPSALIGKWIRDDKVVEFQAIDDYTGYFWMYSFSTGIETSTGFYTDNGDYVYLEDPIHGADITYFYEIVETAVPGEVYRVELTWNVAGGGDVVWGLFE